MTDEELRGRLEDLHKRIEELQSRDTGTGSGQSFMIWIMFVAFCFNGCHF